MPIEVRQITIKSLVSIAESKEDAATAKHDREQLMREVLAECRQMLLDLMRAERER